MEADRRDERLLRDRILDLIDGELSAPERRGLPPALKEYAAERLLDRHLAEQGYPDLIQRSHPHRKKVGDLTPVDLPALLEANRREIEEERQKEHERVTFARESRAALEPLGRLELAET